MAPKIIIAIDDQGRLQADFKAFPGRSCEAAEDRLRRELARLGVQVRGSSIPKSEAQIAQELAQDRQSRGGICPKVKL
jgi:hypothetical protein